MFVVVGKCKCFECEREVDKLLIRDQGGKPYVAQHFKGKGFCKGSMERTFI